MTVKELYKECECLLGMGLGDKVVMISKDDEGICTRYITDLPKTVEKWLSGKKKTHYYDPVYKREEVIYKDD